MMGKIQIGHDMIFGSFLWGIDWLQELLKIEGQISTFKKMPTSQIIDKKSDKLKFGVYINACEN
jgi:hypothetical protein